MQKQFLEETQSIVKSNWWTIVWAFIVSIFQTVIIFAGVFFVNQYQKVVAIRSSQKWGQTFWLTPVVNCID